MKNSTSLLGVFTVAALLAGPGVSAGDWPQWRGPDRNDRSTETGLLKSWPSDGPPLAWKATEIGGGFGGKISVYFPPVAALLSKKSGRPVKLVMSRASVFEATGPTPGSHMRVKLGATKDGKLVAF